MHSPGELEKIDTALARTLPDAWPIFFRGRRLRPMQRSAIPLIVRGDSVLLAAPTASGKTEAAVAPLFQRHVSFQRADLGLVYVAPTKALVNDIYERLRDYLEGRSPGLVQRHTGDRHEFDRADGAFVLVTTPEALDSLILMRAANLASVRAIVIDEIHLLHGAPRGQQLRHVLARLRRATSIPRDVRDGFQIVGMTATIDDLPSVRDVWMGSDGQIVTAGEAREINLQRCTVALGPPVERARRRAAALASWLTAHTPPKVLVFSNSRNGAHQAAAELSRELQGSRWPVHLHIGILGAGERERVEAAMKRERFGICVATSTLEIGIDIGDVDAVALLEPPPTVSAFLQRIGRGNRRTDICRVIALHETDAEADVVDALLRCAETGHLDDAHDYDRPSVRFQQVLSLAWKGVRDDRPLTRRNLADRTGGDSHAEVVSDMLETGALVEVRGALIPADRWMDEGDARRIHTVIAGGGGRSIVDVIDGEVVANAGGPQAAGAALFLGGRLRRVVEAASGGVYLEHPQSGDERRPLAILPSTRGRRGLGRPIVWALAEAAGADPRIWRRDASGLITWGGEGFNRILADLLESNDVAENLAMSDFGLEGLDWRQPLDLSRLREMASDTAKRPFVPEALGRYFAQPSRYYSALSPTLQRREAAHAVPYVPFERWLKDCQAIT